MPIRAIAVDSSAFPKGELNLEEIERWAQACDEHDAEFWIPEVVAYELAHHAREEELKFLATLNSMARTRKKSGLRSINIPPPPSIDDIISSIAEAGAEILTLTGEVARDAILDQVNQTGPAERKKGIKTGSADSAWVRTLSQEARNISDGDIILVCNDHGAQVFLESPELAPNNIRTVSHFGEILTLLGEDSPSGIDDVTLILSSLSNELLSRDSPLMEHGDLPFDSNEVDYRLGVHAEDFALQDRHIDDVEILDPENAILYNAWAGSHYGTVMASFTIRESYVAQDWQGASLLSIYAVASSTAEVTFRAYPEEPISDRIAIEIDDLWIDGNFDYTYIDYDE